MEKIKLLSLFSGIGAFERGLQLAEKDFETVNFCEIDPHAAKCYSAIHNEPAEKNLVDVSKVDTSLLMDKGINLLVHGSPCQAFSSAGKQAGGEKGSGTTSSLLWESVRIITDLKPKYVLWENVENVIRGKHKPVFDDYLQHLEDLGYTNYYEVLAANDFGIPQRRRRIFVVSIIEEDGDTPFVFPKKQPLKKGIEDYIAPEEEDNITDVIWNRYNELFDEISKEDFIKYVEGLPITKGIGTKKLKIYNFNEMDTVVTDTGLIGTLGCRSLQNNATKVFTNGGLYRLSPCNAMELMGFTKEDYEKILPLGRRRQIYDRAGNSIVPQVLCAIYKNLFK